jgi:hypothetical protein
MQTRILSLCDGVMIRICRLLEAAAIHALTTGCERIDVESDNRFNARVAPVHPLHELRHLAHLLRRESWIERLTLSEFDFRQAPHRHPARSSLQAPQATARQTLVLAGIALIGDIGWVWA